MTEYFCNRGAYIYKVIQMAEMATSKPEIYLLPMSHSSYEKICDMTNKQDAAKMNEIPFRSVLGAFLYLSTQTRPNIFTAVDMIAEFQS